MVTQLVDLAEDVLQQLGDNFCVSVRLKDCTMLLLHINHSRDQQLRSCDCCPTYVVLSNLHHKVGQMMLRWKSSGFFACHGLAAYTACSHCSYMHV